MGILGAAVPAGVTAISGFFGIGMKSTVRKGRVLRELAAERRWDLRKRDADVPKGFGGRPFNEGHARMARNVLSGAHQDHRVLVFDYSFRTPGSDGDDTHRFWVACVDDLPAALPVLETLKRTKLSKLRFRRAGVEFLRGDAAFDARYLVTTTSPQLAADVLSPDVIRLLMSWPDLQWRIEGSRLLTWGRGSLKPHWIDPALNMLCALADAIPPEVWRNAGGFGSSAF